VNCTRCGKPIKYIRVTDGSTMTVDDLLAYVVPSDYAHLTAVTPSGCKFRARIATIDDKKALKAYLPHGANCKTHTPKYMIAAREEYERRQRLVVDTQLAFQQKRFEDAHRIQRQKPEPTEKVEQISLYSYL
jgi:hypothetical protein